jgi:hypothetical protein
MKPELKREPRKQPYEKPRLRTIKLSADEVLSTGCKTSPVSTGFGSNLCMSGFCSSSTGS